MPLDAQMISASELAQGAAGWIAVWEENLGKNVLTCERPAAGVPFVLESHFMTCPKKVSLEEAHRHAARHRWFRRLWEANGGESLDGPIPERPPAGHHPTDPDWLHGPVGAAGTSKQGAAGSPKQGYAGNPPTQTAVPATKSPRSTPRVQSAALRLGNSHSDGRRAPDDEWLNQDWRFGA